MDAGQEHATEFRRCLIHMDVSGMMRLWKHVAPHLSNQSPMDALISMHMARCDMKRISLKLKKYSEEWLYERGYQKVDGKWISGPPPVSVIAESVGIAVKSNDPRVRKRIHRAMNDALENSLAKGITEPPIQRENMLKARAKERFKMRLA